MFIIYDGVSVILRGLLKKKKRRKRRWTYCRVNGVMIFPVYSWSARHYFDLFTGRTTASLPTNVISQHCVTVATWAGRAHNAMCRVLCSTQERPFAQGSANQITASPVCAGTWKITSNGGRRWTGWLPPQAATFFSFFFTLSLLYLRCHLTARSCSEALRNAVPNVNGCHAPCKPAFLWNMSG